MRVIAIINIGMYLLFFVLGLLLGGFGAWLIAKSVGKAEQAILAAKFDEAQIRQENLLEEIKDKEVQLQTITETVIQLKEERAELRATLETERATVEAKLSVLDEARQKFADSFKALSAKALYSNNQSFLDLAKATLEKFQEGAKGDLDKRQQAINDLVKPVKESLDKVDSKIQELEKARTGAYESITQQVRSLLETQHQLRTETANLVKALRTPVVRGRWGEIQLKRVVEMAGMVDHCDFYEQESVNAEDGRLRPDMLVRLPAKKNIIVDAKAPLAAYLEALDAIDENERQAKMKEHARHVRNHMIALSKKSYWDQFQHTPEFVVLFLPGETFFSSALEYDPALIEYGVEQRVILATPTTLIALLRAVAYGWRQESIAQNAKEISALGRDLYKRLADLGGHMSRLGRSLGNSVEAYNKAVGTLETRVLVSARKFKELETATGSEIDQISQVEQSPRVIQATELQQE